MRRKAAQPQRYQRTRANSLDFTDAVITSSVLRIAVDTDGLALIYSKLKLFPKDAADHPRLQVGVVGALQFAKVIEQR